MPSTTDDSRVLSHADAAAIAYQVPNDRDPAPGSRGLPQPRTTLEAMSMLAYARSSGISSFWASSPDSSAGDVTTHWIADGGDPLVVRQGETRCILVSAGTGALSPMFARFRPCTAKLADGIVTVAAAAAPPPPPGARVRHWYDPLMVRSAGSNTAVVDADAR